jgi:hypothetical protein
MFNGGEDDCLPAFLLFTALTDGDSSAGEDLPE